MKESCSLLGGFQMRKLDHFEIGAIWKWDLIHRNIFDYVFLFHLACQINQRLIIYFAAVRRKTDEKASGWEGSGDVVCMIWWCRRYSNERLINQGMKKRLGSVRLSPGFFCSLPDGVFLVAMLASPSHLNVLKLNAKSITKNIFHPWFDSGWSGKHF